MYWCWIVRRLLWWRYIRWWSLGLLEEVNRINLLLHFSKLLLQRLVLRCDGGHVLVEKRICVRELCECTTICRRSLCEICYCGREIRVLHFHVRCEALLLCSGVLHFVLNLVFRRESGSKNVEVFCTGLRLIHSQYANYYFPVLRIKVSAALISCSCVNAAPPAVAKR